MLTVGLPFKGSYVVVSIKEGVALDPGAIINAAPSNVFLRFTPSIFEKTVSVFK